MQQDEEFMNILEKIAQDNNTTPEEVYREMQKALMMGWSNNDPGIRSAWAEVPHSGDMPTPEEFINYAAAKAGVAQRPPKKRKRITAKSRKLAGLTRKTYNDA